MNNHGALDAFAVAARAYCEWAEVPADMPGAAEMHSGLHHLAGLYFLALKLPRVNVGEFDPPPISHDEWKVVFKRFGSLPVNYYSSPDPLDIETCEPSMGDLADDMADIWRDLKRGLMLYDAKHLSSAAYEWKEHFVIHWGMHAADALHVLHKWMEGPGRASQPGL